MKFTIEIDCENAAFRDDFRGETSRILLEVHKKILSMYKGPNDSKKVLDSNGNTCGKVEMSR